MPKIVDHDERRQKLLEASWRVIVRSGLEKTTIRELAKESGYSHGTWAYYFEDKEDILVSALRLQHKRIEARIARHLAEHDGIDALRLVILESLPLDEQRLFEAQLEMNFWVRAMTTEQVGEYVISVFQDFQRLLKKLVRRSREAGQLTTKLADDEVVSEVVLLIDALSVEAALSPTLTPPKRQKALVDHLLQQLTGRSRSQQGRIPKMPAKKAAVSSRAPRR